MYSRLIGPTAVTRHVLTGLCPVEVTGAARQDHDRTRRVGLQLLFLELLAQPDVEHTGG